jgi:hypothetical protein
MTATRGHRLQQLTTRVKMDSAIPLHVKTPTVGLDAAGLVALADLTTVQERAALTGTSSFLDLFVLVPGIHLVQRAVNLNAGENPACGALTTGYVFRVENPATVYYLQKVGRTGQLTTLKVTRLHDDMKWYTTITSRFFPLHNTNFIAALAYFAAVSWGITVLFLLILYEDWWGVGVLGILMLARLINMIVMRRRCQPLWSGAREQGVEGDLLILLSQDRWIRMQGLVDDLKTVTSGRWLDDETTRESWGTAMATVLVYLDAALASNIQQLGKILLLSLLIGSAGLLALVNTATDELQMHNCLVKVSGERKKYGRRLHLAEELIKETGRDDWAVRMGMIVKNKPTTATEEAGEVVM